MLNYVRSELYRNFHMKGSYLLIGICGGLVVAMHGVLFWAGTQADVLYDNMNFSMGILLSAGTLLAAISLIVASIAFGDEYKNGTMKNVVAYGFSRMKIFFGKQIAALITAMICFLAILGIFLASGFLLVENASAETWRELFIGLGVMIPNLAAVLAFSVSLQLIMENSTAAQWVGLGVLFVMPPIFELLGMKFPIFAELMEWIPTQAIGNVLLPESGYVWDTAEGMIHCVSVGLVWLAFSLGLGCIGFARRDIR